MEVKTKFNIGDFVYIYNGQTGTINSIVIANTGIMYTVDGSRNNGILFNESEVFSTEKEAKLYELEGDRDTLMSKLEELNKKIADLKSNE